MDLRHDWKSLNTVLFGQNIGGRADQTSSLVLIEDQGRLIDGVLSSGRAFEDQDLDFGVATREKLDGLASKYNVEQAMLLSKKSLEQSLADASFMGTNFYQQLKMIREELLNPVEKLKMRASTEFLVARKHFILDFLGSWVGRLFPRKFNVLLFIDQRNAETGGHFSYKAILLHYVDGVLEEFFEPDFSSLSEERLLNWNLETPEIRQYLVSRYILPTYCFFTFKEDWENIRAQKKKTQILEHFIEAMDSGRSKIYPMSKPFQLGLLLSRIYIFFMKRT